MTRPLDGIRIADFSWYAAGPIAARTLADFGADVIRIESETHIDALRHVQPVKPGTEGQNVSGYFNNFNAGKRSLALNMAHPRGREVALRLVERSDVFLANYSPPVIERWGLGYDALKAVNPRIIAAYEPLAGMSGPHRGFRGWGALVVAVGGLAHLTGFPHRAPFGVGTNYPDYTINPGHLTIAILAALRHRERSGQGQMIELSQVESLASTLGPFLLDYAVNGRNQGRVGNRMAHIVPHGVYRCQDEARRAPPAPEQQAQRERWIAIAVRDAKEWAALCRVAGGQPFSGDERFATILGRKANEDALEEAIGAWTRTQRAHSLANALQEAGCPAGVVHDAEDVLERDEHLKARGYYRYLEHQVTGRSAYDGPVVKLHETPGEVDGPAPLLAEHTFEVATGVLGYTEDEVAELVAEGVLV